MLSVSVCQKNIKKNVQKKQIYNDKYRHARDRLFGLTLEKPEAII